MKVTIAVTMQDEETRAKRPGGIRRRMRGGRHCAGCLRAGYLRAGYLRAGRVALIAAGLSLAAPPLAAEQPISAIDWLSDSLDAPYPQAASPQGPSPQGDLRPAPVVAVSPSPPGPARGTAPAGTALAEDITVTPLDAPDPDALGLLPPSVTGLPRDLWKNTPAHVLRHQIGDLPARNIPAIQSLVKTLLLAEADPPADSDGKGELFLTRIDKLLEMGTIEEAQAMLGLVENPSPALFSRMFDVALLTGNETEICRKLRSRNDLAPGYSTRIFCLARNGDWPTAALTLGLAEALGYVSAEEDALLARFLDPHLFEGEPPLAPPRKITPLLFRMHEAIGEHLTTASLPLAFAHADLRSNMGWKARLEAAERLARAGAMPPSRLLAIYGQHRPAASGGIWDRVRAVQEVEAALRAGDGEALSRALPRAWELIHANGLEVPFAHAFGAALGEFPLTGAGADLARRIALLSPAYEKIARAHPPSGPDGAFLSAIATGDFSRAHPRGPLQEAIARGFADDAPLPPTESALLATGQLGSLLLRLPALMHSGSAGDHDDLTRALLILRHVGLEDVARRAALQTLLLRQEP